MTFSKNPNASVLTITAVYDTPESGRNIKVLLDRLNQQFGEELEFELRLWRGDLLDVPEAYRRARDDAAASELLAIGCSEDEPIRDGVEDLVAGWSAGHDKMEQALVALLLSNAAKGDVLDELHQLANRHGLNFISYEEAQADEGSDSAAHLPTDRGAVETERQSRFCGINE